MKIDNSFWEKHPIATTTELSFSGMHLEAIPEQVFEYKELTYLSFKSSRMTEIPAQIGNLSKLKTLILDSNKLEVLPEEICLLSELTQLSISRNALSTLPDEIGNLNKLYELDLERNQLKTLPKSIGQLKNLYKFRLNENSLETLPDEICNLANLGQLYLYENNLSTIPENIGHLGDLTYLSLRQNNLKEIPNSIGELKSLRELFLDQNKLIELPTSIEALNLWRIKLDKNKFKKFPYFLLKIQGLKSIEGLGKFYNLNTLNTFYLLRDFYIKNNWLNKEDWLIAFYLIANEKEKLENLPSKDLLKPLFFKDSLLKKNALAILSNNNTINQTSSIAILSKMKALSQKELISYLDDNKIAHAFEFTKETTHILLNLPLDIKHFETIEKSKNSYAFITEASIKNIIDSGNKDLYLLEETQVSEEYLSKIKQLLLGTDDDKKVALEILVGGGGYQKLLNEFFVAYQTTPSSPLRKKIEAAIKVYLSPKGQTALKHFGFKEEITEKKLWTRFNKHLVTSEDFNPGVIASLLFNQFSLGYSCTLKIGSSTQKKAFLQKSIEGNTLFFKEKLNDLPPLPEEINAFTHLKVIDLSNCYISKFPKVLFDKKLPNLKEIVFRKGSENMLGMKKAQKSLPKVTISFR